MPRKKQPKSAYDLSLLRLSDVIARACVRMSSETNEEDSISSFVKEIPRFAANDYVREVLWMIHTFKHTKYLRNALHPECTVLSISRRKVTTDVDLSLLKNMDVLRKLKQLDLSFYFHSHGGSTTTDEVKAEKSFTNNIRNMSALVSLKLYFVCTTTMLAYIAEYCPNLEQLLIEGGNYKSRDSRLLDQCSKLNWLEMTSDEAYLTDTDTIYLLNHLPKLKHFRIENITSVLDTLSESQRKKTYALKSLGEPCGEVIYERHLESLFTYFPLLEEVNFTSAGNFSPLRKFVHLTTLRVSGESSEDFGDLAPVLLNCSQLINLSMYNVPLRKVFKRNLGVTFPALTELILTNCMWVDISAIDIQCPNLETFHFDTPISKLFPLPFLTVERPFSNLKSLTAEQGVISTQHLLFLLCSCFELRDLSISERNCYFALPDMEMEGQGMNNQLWNLLLQKNPLKKLQRLSIRSNEITNDIIPTILDSFDDLRYLSLNGMDLNLLPSECEELKAQLQTFNMTVDVNGRVLYSTS